MNLDRKELILVILYPSQKIDVVVELSHDFSLYVCIKSFKYISLSSTSSWVNYNAYFRAVNSLC